MTTRQTTKERAMQNHPMTEEELERDRSIRFSAALERTAGPFLSEASDRVYDLEEKLLRMTADRDRWRKLRLEALDLIKELEQPSARGPDVIVD